MNNVIHTSTDDIEIIDVSEYSEDLTDYFSDMPKVARPLLKGAKEAFSKIEQMLYSSPAFINLVKASIPEQTFQAILTDDQKVKIAKATLNEMEKELKDNNDIIDKSAEEFDKAEKEVDDFGDEVEDAGKQSSNAEGKFSKVKSVVAGVGKALAVTTATIGAAAVATGKKLKDMADETASTGDAVDKNSQRLGLSKKAYQEWDYVLSQSGVDVTSVQTGFKSMTNSIDDAKNGTETAVKKFTALGISMSDLKNLSREEIFDKAIKGLQNIKDDTTKAALANDLFGKSGQNIMPLLNSTAESTEKLKNKAHDLGMVMSDEAVQAAVDYTDNMDTLKRTFGGLKNSIMGDILPGFNDILKGLTGLMTGADGAGEQFQTGAMAYQEMGENAAARQSLLFYADYIEKSYLGTKGFVERLDSIDPSPENYWTKTLPDIKKKIQALPCVEKVTLLGGNDDEE